MRAIVHRMITMPFCLKQTDGQTDRRTIPRQFVLTNAPRAKNEKSYIGYDVMQSRWDVWCSMPQLNSCTTQRYKLVPL